jgi:carbonic anhydrase
MQQQVNCREIHVVMHTDCSGPRISTPRFRERVKAEHPGDEAVAKAADEFEFQEYQDIEQTVRDGIEYLRNHPLMVKETRYTGWVYELETGKV